MQSVDELSADAKIAYRAFLDMGRSKTAHFSYMQTLRARYQSGGAPSEAEKLELQRLLGEHDKNVLAFKTAMAAVTDSDENQILFELMS